MTEPRPTSRAYSRYDHDPDAITWARQKVLGEINRAENLARQATNAGATETAEFWTRHARALRQAFIGGEDCVYGRFDERLPELARAVDGEWTE